MNTVIELGLCLLLLHGAIEGIVSNYLQVHMSLLKLISSPASPAGNITDLEVLGNFDKAVSRIPIIDLLRGRDGLPGRDGKNGEQGPRGERGMTGAQGPPGPRSAGVTYTRWGKSSCPSTPGTELVYSGIVGGTFYNSKGGGAEKLCMPTDPDYLSGTTGLLISSLPQLPVIDGAEYEFHSGPKTNIAEHNVPCAVCYASSKAAMIMVPAKSVCPSSWTREYYGYLTTEYKTHQRSSFNCIDVDPDVLAGGTGSTNGALFYHVLSTCNGFQCPPYQANRALSCTVCTK